MTKPPITYSLVLGDALDWLLEQQPETVHAVVTDPPFGLVEYASEQLRKRRNGQGGIWRLPPSFDGWRRLPAPRFTVLRPADRNRIYDFHSRLAKACLRVLVPGSHVVMASQSLLAHLVIRAFVGAGFEMRGQVARIVKTFRGGDRPKGAHEEFPEVSVMARACWEPWLLFRKPCDGTVKENLRRWGTGALRRPSLDKPFSDLIQAGPPKARERAVAPHPSLKPQELMRPLVWAALPFGRGVVVDPFMGSGATIAAATALGLRAIGIESYAQYFVMAKRAVPILAAMKTRFDPGVELVDQRAEEGA